MKTQCAILFRLNNVYVKLCGRFSATLLLVGLGLELG